MRHVLAGVLIALLVCSLLWAALPFTDAFTNTNGTVLTTHNASWTMNTGTAGIYNNYLVSRTAGEAFIARVNSETFADDQYAQCTIAATPVNNYNMGPAVRVSTSGAQTLYFTDFDDDQLRVRKTVAGSSTTLTTPVTRTQAVGETLKITVSGTQLRVYVDNVEIGGLAVTDASISSGAAGMRGFNYAGSDGLGQNGCDSFEAGDYSAGGSSAPIRRRPIMMFFTLPELSK